MKKLFLSSLLLLAITNVARAEETTESQALLEQGQDVTAVTEESELLAPEDTNSEAMMEPNYLRPPHRRPPGRYPSPYRPPRRPPIDRRYPPPYYPHTQTITCSSNNYRYNECYVGGYIRNAGLQNRISRSDCQYGYSWGFYNDRIWVDHGCRATFWVEAY
jgi:hypothetical protein